MSSTGETILETIVKQKAVRCNRKGKLCPTPNWEETAGREPYSACILDVGGGGSRHRNYLTQSLGQKKAFIGGAGSLKLQV